MTAILSVALLVTLGWLVYFASKRHIKTTIAFMALADVLILCILMQTMTGP